MLSSHNTIPSKSVQPQDGRGEAGGGAGVEVGDREPRGSSKNKERIITATHQPWVHHSVFDSKVTYQPPQGFIEVTYQLF